MWFVPDAVLVVQSHASRVDLAIAHAYVAGIRTIRDTEHAVIARGKGLRVYQDLRSLRVIDRDARAYLAESIREDFGIWNLAANKLELSPQTPIVRVTIQLVARVLETMGLPSIDASVDIAAELERDAVRRPSADRTHEERHARYGRLAAGRAP